MKEQIIDAVRKAFSKLIEEDGYLFDCPIEEGFEYDARKLHEVCINHKFANYLEKFILPIIERGNVKYFVDIEFNKEGINKKQIKIAGEEKVVRPDIIIHNRKTGDEKDNVLVVECKKVGAPDKELQDDEEKIIAFIENEKYSYQFGLQVIYGKDIIEGTLFYPADGEISRQKINFC